MEKFIVSKTFETNARPKKDPNYAWKCLGELTGKRPLEGIRIKKGNRWCSDKEAADEYSSHFIGKVDQLKRRDECSQDRSTPWCEVEGRSKGDQDELLPASHCVHKNGAKVSQAGKIFGCKGH
jgi:hypothetical protein